MSDRQRLVVKILLFLAKYLNDSDEHAKELGELATHISFYIPRDKHHA